MMLIGKSLGAMLVGYLCGSIPFSFLIGRFAAGVDIREKGSGNIGATNLMRVAGYRLGAAGFACDFLKGLLPTLLAGWWLGEPAAIATGLAAMAGHTFPVWLKGAGGKGVATGGGVFFALAPFSTFYALLVFLMIGPVATRTVSAGSVAAALILPFLCWRTASLPVTLIAAAAGLFVIYRHRGNIERLYDGSESRLWKGLE